MSEDTSDPASNGRSADDAPAADDAPEADLAADGVPANDLATNGSGGPERTSLAGGEPVEILLVEDNPGDVRLTEEAFREGRIENNLHVATDGVEALEFLEQRGEYEDAPRPDLVLLDLNLPRKNGEEVLAELKEDPELRCIPVIVLTSSAAEEDVVTSYELHANAYLTKPVDPDDFIETVQSFEQFWFSIVRLPPVEEDS